MIEITLSIIIVTYKRHVPLCNTLHAIGPFIRNKIIELLVIDQCPVGPLPNNIINMPNMRYVVLDKPGMVRARNIGLELAKGDIVLFLDDDIVPSSELVDAHMHAYGDLSIGGVAGRILDYQSVFSDTKADPRMFDLVSGWKYSNFNHTIEVDMMTSRGCNMSFRRKLLKQLGGFDSNIEIFRDDTDMCLRVIEAGFRIRFVPEALVIHLNARSGGTRAPEDKLNNYWSSEWRSYKQHYRHYRDNLYFLMRHFHGAMLLQYILIAYRDYVGLSRWPWRLAAKNISFFSAFLNAFRLITIRKLHPCKAIK